MEGSQEEVALNASKAQMRFRWSRPGKGQSYRQTWCPLSNIRQWGVVLATCPPALDQELGRFQASGKSLEFRPEHPARKGLRARLTPMLKD